MDRTRAETRNLKMMAIPLYNLGCGGGRAALAERALSQEPGVFDVYANPATEAIYIKYDAALTSREALLKALEPLGLGSPN